MESPPVFSSKASARTKATKASEMTAAAGTAQTSERRAGAGALRPVLLDHAAGFRKGHTTQTGS